MPIKILIIEPDKKVLACAKKLLVKANYKLSCASNLEQGTKLIDKNCFDLVLCDTQISKTNGYAFLWKLIQNPKTKPIPFIFLTSKVGKKEIQTATSLGADGFIFKPIDPEKLFEAIERNILKYNYVKTKNINANHAFNFENTGKIKTVCANDHLFRIVNNQPAFIKIADLKCIVAHGTYLKAFLSDGRSYKTRRTLSVIEKYLPGEIFLRIHRSTIINIVFVEKIENWFNNTFRVYIKDIKIPFEMSRRYASRVKSRL